MLEMDQPLEKESSAAWDSFGVKDLSAAKTLDKETVLAAGAESLELTVAVSRPRLLP